MVLSTTSVANSALVFGLSNGISYPSPFGASNNSPNTITALVAGSVSSNPANINNLTANVAAPAVADFLLADDVSLNTLLATNLGTGTSIDSILEQGNNAFAADISAITSEPLASLVPESSSSLALESSASEDEATIFSSSADDNNALGAESSFSSNGVFSSAAEAYSAPSSFGTGDSTGTTISLVL